MFARIERWFALTRYRHSLPRLLVQRYGRERNYTPAQVLTTIRVHRLNQKYAAYACAMFCSKKAYTEFVDEQKFESVGPSGWAAGLASAAWLSHAEISDVIGSSDAGWDSPGIDFGGGDDFSFDGGAFDGGDSGGGDSGGGGDGGAGGDSGN